MGTPRGGNLIPSVLRFFGQWLVAMRDSRVLEFYYSGISEAKQCKSLWGSQSKNVIFFNSPGDQLLDKEPEDSGYEIVGRVTFSGIATLIPYP